MLAGATADSRGTATCFPIVTSGDLTALLVYAALGPSVSVRPHGSSTSNSILYNTGLPPPC